MHDCLYGVKSTTCRQAAKISESRISHFCSHSLGVVDVPIVVVAPVVVVLAVVVLVVENGVVVMEFLSLKCFSQITSQKLVCPLKYPLTVSVP